MFKTCRILTISITFLCSALRLEASQEYWLKEADNLTEAIGCLRTNLEKAFALGANRSIYDGGWNFQTHGIDRCMTDLHSRVVVARNNAKNAKSQRENEISATQANVNALAGTVNRLEQSNKLLQDNHLQIHEELVLTREQFALLQVEFRQQSSVIQEMMQLLRLVQGQTAPGPQFNFGLNTDPDAASQASFGGESTNAQ